MARRFTSLRLRSQELVRRSSSHDKRALQIGCVVWNHGNDILNRRSAASRGVATFMCLASAHSFRRSAPSTQMLGRGIRRRYLSGTSADWAGDTGRLGDCVRAGQQWFDADIWTALAETDGTQPYGRRSRLPSLATIAFFLLLPATRPPGDLPSGAIAQLGNQSLRCHRKSSLRRNQRLCSRLLGSRRLLRLLLAAADFSALAPGQENVCAACVSFSAYNFRRTSGQLVGLACASHNTP